MVVNAENGVYLMLLAPKAKEAASAWGKRGSFNSVL
jgi:hypothetical protein